MRMATRWTSSVTWSATCARRPAVQYLDGRVAIPNNVLFFSDGLHPNQRGHRALAKFLKAEMERLGWLP